ncbi:hypothetical protein FHH43_07590 [Clostridium perfringens]|nr:hypothetical protein [Clostridium perfringens]
MYYILVKSFNSIGSIVYESSDSNEIDSLDDFLNEKLNKGLKEVIILSNLEMWKEYEPFNIIKNVGEFIDKAILS